MIDVMVTQEWAYLQAQPCDIPQSRWIKVHALRDGRRSYCGLTNQTDVGQMEVGAFIKHEDACKRCAKAVEAERRVA